MNDMLVDLCLTTYICTYIFTGIVFYNFKSFKYSINLVSKKSISSNLRDIKLNRSHNSFVSIVHSFIAKSFCILFVSVFYNVNPYAFELFDSVQVHGFASQSMFLTSGNNMFGPSISNPSFAFTEIGINGSWVPLPNLRLSMQILSRRAGDWHNGSPVIDFGLMDYSFNFENDYRIGVRGGRVRQPWGIYNDTRDVAFTRPSILLPQSIYYEGTRDYTISADGLMIYGESRKPWGNLTMELFGGYARTDDKDTQYSFLFQQAYGYLESNPSFVGRLNYESYDGNLRFALSGVHSSMQYKPNLEFDILAKGSIYFSAILLSAQYNTEKWSFTSEYSPSFFQRKGFGTGLDFNYFGQSYYFQAAYRFAPKWELMARYDAAFPNSNDENGSKFEAETGYPGYTQFAKNWSVGLRWDITSSMMVRAEYDYANGTYWAPNAANLNQQPQQYWNIFGFLVSFRF